MDRPARFFAWEWYHWKATGYKLFREIPYFDEKEFTYIFGFSIFVEKLSIFISFSE
jgi:hypothetical protein